MVETIAGPRTQYKGRIYVSRIKGDLEDELSEWEILVGPAEAADLTVFFKKSGRNVKLQCIRRAD